WSSAGGADSTVLVAVRDMAGNTGSVLTVAAVVTPPPEPPVPPVPPVQQVPVVTEPPPPADTKPGVTGPSDVVKADPATGDTPLPGNRPAGGILNVAPGTQPAAGGLGGPAGP
ncbi:hypothetical protein GTP91_34245, partial [Rugamonas sp. FT82W]|nr:hypothetical protein [Duganella vulcania]